MPPERGHWLTSNHDCSHRVIYAEVGILLVLPGRLDRRNMKALSELRALGIAREVGFNVTTGLPHGGRPVVTCFLCGRRLSQQGLCCLALGRRDRDTVAAARHDLLNIHVGEVIRRRQQAGRNHRVDHNLAAS